MVSRSTCCTALPEVLAVGVYEVVCAYEVVVVPVVCVHGLPCYVLLSCHQHVIGGSEAKHLTYVAIGGQVPVHHCVIRVRGHYVMPCPQAVRIVSGPAVCQGEGIRHGFTTESPRGSEMSCVPYLV